MKTLRYSDKQPVRKGDVFTAPRWGTCTVESFDRLNGCAVAVNLSTGEIFDMLGQPTFGESDLIRRKPENITRTRMAAESRRLKDRRIREHLIQNPENLRARVCRNGHCHVYTTRQRGDGGPRPWWMFAGFRAELVREIETTEPVTP